MVDDVSPAQFRAQMIDRHRPSFELWGRCHEELERVVPQSRDTSQAYARALDILFVQGFKSHGSLYVLCVRGHGEDGATILRRLLEIALQVGYLSMDASKRQERAEKYLAWFWRQTPDRLQTGLPQAEGAWWRMQYDRHKHLLIKSSGKPFRNWWGDSSIRDLANDIGM